MSNCRPARERIQAAGGAFAGHIVCGYRKLREGPSLPVRAHVAAAMPSFAPLAYEYWCPHSAWEKGLLACRIREGRRSCLVRPIATPAAA